MTDIPKIKLNAGNEIPQLGFGVFQISNHDDAVKVVESAISNGYRLIDTAEAYNNQTAVGEAIKNSDVNRDDIFLTTKLWVSNFTYEKATKPIDQDLQELGTDYIDMMLLHQAQGDFAGAWHTLEDAQKAGKIKSIGVSNFWPDQLINLQLMSNVKPVVNQIEVNPQFQREPEVKWNQKDDVAVEAWAPFTEGKDRIFTNPVLAESGKKYGKSNGQVILR